MMGEEKPSKVGGTTRCAKGLPTNWRQLAECECGGSDGINSEEYMPYKNRSTSLFMTVSMTLLPPGWISASLSAW